MLSALSIRDVVLIERLDLSFGAGLTVLTGETGAGKSILLDSLGLALGARADAGLVRPGAEQASVSASFAPRTPVASTSLSVCACAIPQPTNEPSIRIRSTTALLRRCAAV